MAHISASAIMVVFSLLAVLNIVNDVQTLTFVEMVSGCTNDNDGLLMPAMLLASQTCITFGSTSIDNGCVTGTFNSYNTSDCTGDVIGKHLRNTCSAAGANKVIYRCSSYNDAEYMRSTVFLLANGQYGADNCTDPLKVVSFTRLNFCYPGNLPGNQPGPLSYKFEKAKATAFHGPIYNDANCNSLNRSQDGTVDGACRFNIRVEFVSANLLGSFATSVGHSAGFTIGSIVLMAFLVL